MLKGRLITTSWSQFQKRYAQKSAKVVKGNYEEQGIAKIRNIGILAHIDAGLSNFNVIVEITYYHFIVADMNDLQSGR